MKIITRDITKDTTLNGDTILTGAIKEGVTITFSGHHLICLQKVSHCNILPPQTKPSTNNFYSRSSRSSNIGVGQGGIFVGVNSGMVAGNISGGTVNMSGAKMDSYSISFLNGLGPNVNVSGKRHDINVSGPIETDTHLETKTGHINVEDVGPDSRLHSKTGNIKARNISETSVLDSKTGEVDYEDIVAEEHKVIHLI